MLADTEMTLPDEEFASTMQQLVAEAAKAIAPKQLEAGGELGSGEQASREIAALSERIAGVEKLIAGGNTELGMQLQRMAEQIVAVRNTESVNQRLFNSLHDELKSYRDNFLRESLQKPFIRDLVVLLDDLSTIASQMENAGVAGAVARWSANLQNAIHSLVEILHRMEVTEIEPKERVDRTLHRVVSYEPAEFAEDDGRIVMRIKRGFIWRNQVLRPEEVVAKRFG
jgi:molecular chaperone GrpE (heat shock protein)